jgi:hypothetical protein
MLSLLKRMFMPSAPAPVTKAASTPRDKAKPKPRRFVEIRGESHYQEALSTIAGGKTPDGHLMPVAARVIPEDGNPADPMAVRVEVRGQTVGYLSRYQARQFRKRSSIAVDCSAKIVGGWDRGRGDTGHFGIELDLTL